VPVSLTPPGVPPSGLNILDLNRIRRMGETPEGLRAATKEFEAFVLYQLMQSMRKTVEKNPLFHGGAGEEVFEDMLDQELTRQLAHAGGIGIGEVLYRQLERQVKQRQSQQSPSGTVSHLA